jgi:hypothetical protein
MWVTSSFSTGLPSSPQAMVYCLPGFRPAGNILSILSKNPGESLFELWDTAVKINPGEFS